MSVKVKAAKRYSDILLNRVIEKDELLEVTEKRAEHLVHEGMVEIVKEAIQKKQIKDAAE